MTSLVGASYGSGVPRQALRLCREPKQLSAAIVFVIWGIMLESLWVVAAAVMAVLYSHGLAAWHERDHLIQRFATRGSAEGISAFARSLEHMHLRWAWLGMFIRLPIVRSLLQILVDASGGYARVAPRRPISTRVP